MATALCPTCGTARTGSFRYCRSCGLDFDGPAPNASTPAPVAPATTPAPEAAAATPAGPPAAGTNDQQQQPPAGDVVVIQVRHLKLGAWVIAGGMIGAMLAGALVVPFFGAANVLLGSVAGIVTIVGSAWIGMRVGTAATHR